MENKRPEWTSRYTFMLAAIGSAVGLGNIWRFPYIMGKYGGAVFLIIYLILILTICFIPLITELSIGKITKKECIGAYEQINPKFKIFGFFNIVTAILVASFYFVVGGWILNYIYQSAINYQIENYDNYFSAFTQEAVSNCILTLLFLGICTFFTARGIKKGIEIANNVMMPIFAVILIFLIFISLSLPNAHIGLEYMFKPDFSKLNAEMVLAALGQALFTLSIGMGALLTYGSYIKEDKNIVKSTYTIIFADTAFALMAGIMIFPAVFSFGLEPNSGAGLVFVTLPAIFTQIPYGNIVAVAFFILLFTAATTSGISIMEAPIATFIEQFKLSRTKASIIIFLLIAFLAIPAALSFGILSNNLIFKKTFFDFLDFTTSNILMPLNTLFLCLIAGWVLKLNGNTLFQNKIAALLFNIGLKYVVPIILIGVFITGLK